MLNILQKKKITDTWERDLKKSNSIYNFIIGGRNGRKSSKIQLIMFERFLKNHSKFLLVRRRTDETVTVNWFTPYVQEFLKKRGYTIEYKKQLKKGEKYTGYFELVNEETGTREIFGKIMFLSVEQKYKSNEDESYSEYTDVVFEEFIAEEDKLYLQNEPQKLVNLISTVFRDRAATVYLIGNTLDGQETNPYFRYFEIDDIDLKVNTYYQIENEEHTKIAIFYVANVLKNSIPQYQKIAGNLVGTTGEWKESRYVLTEKLDNINGTIKLLPLKLIYRGTYYYIYQIEETGYERPYIFITTELRSQDGYIDTFEEFLKSIPERHQKYQKKVLNYLYPSFFTYDFIKRDFVFVPQPHTEKYKEFNIDDRELRKELSKKDNVKKLELLNQYLYNLQVFSTSKSLIYWLKNERKEYVKNLIW